MERPEPHGPSMALDDALRSSGNCDDKEWREKIEIAKEARAFGARVRANVVPPAQHSMYKR